MKQLTCDMCGSTDLIKEDGVFVCQHCGTKYSVEEAKKMMIEGTVDVTGSTVKVDTSKELANLYEIARRAKADNNSENAQKYYEQILMKDPSSWEANFYTVYYQSMNCKIANIQSAAIRLSNCEDSVVSLIKQNVTDPDERKKAVDEIGAKLIIISDMLFNAAKNHYDGISYQIKANYTQEFLNNCCASRDILYNYGNYMIQFFGDDYAVNIAVPCWKEGIRLHQILMPYFAQKEVNKNTIMSYVTKIQKYDSTYPTPDIKTSGCYVATAVYGSYDCPQVWTLRRYRDNFLAQKWYGRIFIKCYYCISPALVRRFGNTVWFNKLFKIKLDNMVERLNNKGFKNTPYKDR